MANITSDLLRRGTETSNGIGDDQVDLAGVGLGRDVVAAGEAEFLAEELVELITLGGVVLEDLEERGLSARGTLGTAELELFADLLDAVEVEHEILGPLGGALADGDELGGLQVSVGEGGLG